MDSREAAGPEDPQPSSLRTLTTVNQAHLSFVYPSTADRCGFDGRET